MQNSVGLFWCRAGIGAPVLRLSLIAALIHCHHSGMYPTQHHNRQWLLKVRSPPQWWTHTLLAQSLRQFRDTDAYKYDWGHTDACQVYPQALLRKQSYMCDKWIEGFPISWIWWCFRINCKVLCLVYYYSVGPHIPFIFLIVYFRDILKISKIQTIFKKIMQSVMQCVICCAHNPWNL